MSTPAKALEASIVIEPNSVLPIAQPTMQIVEITAPATLDAGYTFEAVYNNEVFTVTVPPGGVKEGQRMEVPYQPQEPIMAYGEAYAEATPLLVSATAVPMNHGIVTASAPSSSYYNTDGYNNNNMMMATPSSTTPLLSTSSSVKSHSAVPSTTVPHSDIQPHPIGYWKDGLFDCCKYGCCHISLLCSCIFPRIMIAQILTRMKLTICGNSNTTTSTTTTANNNTQQQAWKKTYIQMWIIVLSFCLFQWLFGCPMIHHLYFSAYGIGNYNNVNSSAIINNNISSIHNRNLRYNNNNNDNHYDYYHYYHNNNQNYYYNNNYNQNNNNRNDNRNLHNNNYYNNNNNNNNNDQDVIGKVIDFFFRLKYGNHNKDDTGNSNHYYFDYDPHCQRGVRTINIVVTSLMALYTFYILVKLRIAVRKKYHIPTGQTCSTASCCCFCGIYLCHPIEDYCCSLIFPCCTIAQLARQTAQYDTNPAVCCSNNGLQQPTEV